MKINGGITYFQTQENQNIHPSVHLFLQLHILTLSGADINFGLRSEEAPSKTTYRYTPYKKSAHHLPPARPPARPALKKATSTPMGSSQSPAIEELLNLITRVEEDCWKSSKESSG
ncbi:MAG: ORF3 protein [Anelloviridae sp.]|nr:MAG: ORF3 protein [Anelloviridae sp.]